MKWSLNLLVMESKSPFTGRGISLSSSTLNNNALIHRMCKSIWHNPPTTFLEGRDRQNQKPQAWVVCFGNLTGQLELELIIQKTRMRFQAQVLRGQTGPVGNWGYSKLKEDSPYWCGYISDPGLLGEKYLRLCQRTNSEPHVKGDVVLLFLRWLFV